MSLTQTRWEMKAVKRLWVGKSHNGQLRWIRVGKHEPCSITNRFFLATVVTKLCLTLEGQGGECVR